MNTRKLLDKFRGWALHDPVMKQELLDAEAEFFAFYDGPEAGGDEETLKGLFLEWFLYDRKTTRYLKTPVEVFVHYGGRGLPKKEKEFFKTLPETVFGMFEVLLSDQKTGFVRVKRLDGAGEWNIKDILGSQSMKPGHVLFARVVPLTDTPIFTGWVAGFSENSSTAKDIFKKAFDTPEKITPLRPRDLLKIWSKPINWLEKGEFFCKTRLAGIWQKWAGADMPFSIIEKAVDCGNHDEFMAAQKVFFERMPVQEEALRTMEIMNAWWNLASGKKAGLPAPAEYAGTAPYGPVETKYTKKLMNHSFELFQKTGEELSREDSDAWLKDPANGENGKSPFTLIYEERKSRNHPYPDKIGYSMKVQAIENKAVEPASKTAQEALKLMMRKDFKKAEELFVEALKVLRHDKTVSFKVLGNLGICYALMGQKARAIETLREALRHNPDYDRARKHLSYLEAMSGKQYEKFVKEMPHKLILNEWRE